MSPTSGHGRLLSEAELLRTLEDGAYTLGELYGECESRADIARDRGLHAPDEDHRSDTVWRRRLRGALQSLRANGHAHRAGRAVWVLRGTREHPTALVLLAANGELDNVELYLADAVELLQGLQQPADLVFCDPPYGLGRGTANSSASRVYRRNHEQVIPGYVDVDPDTYAKFTRRWVAAAAGALRPGGQLTAITGPQRAAIVQVAGEESGLEWVASIAAFREFALYTTRRFACSHWTITVMCRGPLSSPRRVFNPPEDLPKSRSGGEYPLDWWAENGRADRPGALRYDNGLPGKLVRRVIAAHSNPEELVVDPTCGGGSTAIHARALSRRFIGGDLNPHALRFTAARLLAEHAWRELPLPTPSGQPNNNDTQTERDERQLDFAL